MLDILFNENLKHVSILQICFYFRRTPGLRELFAAAVGKRMMSERLISTARGSILEHHRSADWAEKAYSNLFAMLSHYEIERDVRSFDEKCNNSVQYYSEKFDDYADQHKGHGDIEDTVQVAKKNIRDKAEADVVRRKDEVNNSKTVIDSRIHKRRVAREHATQIKPTEPHNEEDNEETVPLANPEAGQTGRTNGVACRHMIT